MSGAADLLAAAHAVLLDFDGPVTPLMPSPANRDAADAARSVLEGRDLGEVSSTSDHLAVIRWTATHVPEALPEVETVCVRAELEAAESSRPTPGAHELIEDLHARGVPVVIVSNNAAEAVRAYLDRWNLSVRVRDVVGRPPHRPDLMKPHPHLVQAALQITDAAPRHAVFVGDSVTDIEVARTAGVRSIGYAKTPRRGAELHDAGADAITDRMSDLAAARPNLP